MLGEFCLVALACAPWLRYISALLIHCADKGAVMSAYGIGAGTARVPSGATAKSATKEQKARKPPATKSNVPETIVKWIPGEAITLYAGIIGIGAAQGALTGQETPQQLLERIEAGSFNWFLTGAVVAILLVIVGSLTSNGPHSDTRPSVWGLAIRAALTLVAFALWTSALPGSWTYSLNLIRDIGPAYALLLVPLGLLFAGAAEMLTRGTRL